MKEEKEMGKSSSSWLHRECREPCISADFKVDEISTENGFNRDWRDIAIG